MGISVAGVQNTDVLERTRVLLVKQELVSVHRTCVESLERDLVCCVDAAEVTFKKTQGSHRG